MTTLSQIQTEAMAAAAAAQSALNAAMQVLNDLTAYIAANPPAPPPPAPAPSGAWVTLAPEWNPYPTAGTFTITAAQAPALVQFGAGTTWVQKTFAAGTYTVSVATFGTDPARGVSKEAQLWVPAAAPAPAPAPAPSPAPAPAVGPVFVAQPGLVVTGSVVSVDVGTTSPPATSYAYSWFEYSQTGAFVGSGNSATYTPINANDVVSCVVTPYNGGTAGTPVAIPGVIVP